MHHKALLFVTALAGCAPSVAPERVAQTSELTGRVPEAARSCVATFPSQNLRVIDSSTLAYGYGRTIYVNRLAGPCPGISQTSTLIVDVQSGQYCRGDRVRGLEPGAIIPGPRCLLGDWVPYRSR